MRVLHRYTAWLLMFTVVLAACSSVVPTASAPVPTAAPSKVKVVITPFLSYAPFFIAQDEGFFAEQNLDVEFVNLPGTSQAVPSLISGEVDVLPSPIGIAFLNAVARGSRLRIVADKGQYIPNHCVADALVVRPSVLADHPLKGAADLKGLKISYSEANLSHYLLESYLSNNGLTFNDIQPVNLSSTASRESISAGAIDASFFGEPALSSDVAAGKVVVWQTDAQITPDREVSMVLYGPNLLDKNPDVGRRFMLAYFKAVRQYSQGPTDRNLEIVAKYTKLDQAVLKAACWQYISLDGTIDAPSITHFADWAVGKKLLDRAPTVDEFWDHSFIDYANQAMKTTP